jgi:hypothetical protein
MSVFGELPPLVSTNVEATPVSRLSTRFLQMGVREQVQIV